MENKPQCERLGDFWGRNSVEKSQPHSPGYSQRSQTALFRRRRWVWVSSSHLEQPILEGSAVGKALQECSDVTNE